MLELECYCGETVKADLKDEFDLDKDPGVVDTILAGTFMTVTCSACGKTLKPELPIRVRQESVGLDVFLVPELDRMSFLTDRLEYEVGDASRVAIGYPELVEKVRISRAGLDDRIVEILKYYLLSRALESNPGTNPRIFYRENADEDALVFQVEGLDEDRIGLTRVPQQIYIKTQDRLEKISTEDPFDEILEPPYVSVNTLYQSR